MHVLPTHVPGARREVAAAALDVNCRVDNLSTPSGALTMHRASRRDFLRSSATTLWASRLPAVAGLALAESACCSPSSTFMLNLTFSGLCMFAGYNDGSM